MKTRFNVALCALSAFVFCACGSGESGGNAAKSRTGAALDFTKLAPNISEAALEKHIRYLASDELEGRAPGSRGEELTLAYLTEAYSGMGLRPGNPNGMYVQEVPLIGTTVVNQPTLELKTKSGTKKLTYLDEFMGWTLRQEEESTIEDAELVFVGYGTVAPEYGWDDYKDVDVTGKVIVMLVGDPPLPDTTMFGGKAMTYYGRWTYKFEIAAKKGAAGAIIIHNTAAAGYPWGVVSNSWSGEQFDVVRADEGRDRCYLESWITEPAAIVVFEEAGLGLTVAYKRALSRTFRPIPMGITASTTLRNEFRKIRSYNVVARIEGNDPQYKDEYVIYTAHWDHLGRGNSVDGDDIYNGALDNASGVAATLEIARAFVAYKSHLKRSILIINTTAEESGLLGAYHYAEQPLYPLAKTVAVINIDGLNVWGGTSDMVVVGFGNSDLDRYLEKAIVSQERYLRPDAEPEKGYYYRSDHFPFAKKGVPALYADSGIEYVGRPSDWGM
ncbi:MAG: M20/M25/M40 family metallo-hydrolase, partial [bacterium]|nr:M20/M25/M40 family metallo-hydrolase [bacterium]